MELEFTKPICFFDLETTGINIAQDKIVEISILKVFPNANKESFTKKVNPEIPIPLGASAVHGIYDKDVINEPTFKELANQVAQFIKGCDLAGYNSDRFDIPLLAEEMLRAGHDFDLKNVNTIDVQTIFHKKEKRTLEAAFKFYCNKDLKDGHSAEADTLATYEVLKGQLAMYDDLKNDAKWLSEFSEHQKFADFAGFVRLDEDGNEVFGFGKNKGKLVEEIFKKEPGYFAWIQNADFPLYTKKVLTAIKLRKLTNR